MEEKDYLKDIQDIRSMMAQSSQFISLSGLSGILAGIYALIGAFLAYYLITNDQSYYITYESTTFQLLLLIAAVVLLLSIVTAYLLTVRKAKKVGEKVWNPTSRRLIVNFSIPLVTGGIFTLLLLKSGYFLIIAPITLIFYGLACVNASKYTLRDVRYLGITQIVLGLIATEFPGYGLHFWAVGFGICHIVYGSVMHYKYDRN
ncbi:hypothetical protein [Flavobacterium sp.]|uniref:hypothetical protein n=1 Tax=Flavobacterium sp. TaxID=239 RepID=UPI002B4B4B4F|nr:hypothetical protein [Flavobacterium sp.]HLP64571.1 hypothetical protein [Flavobacterium sp.]